MADRYAAGFTIAGFPLTAALFAASAGNYVLGAVLGAVFLIISGLVVAPRVPCLNRLPALGSARLEAKFRANSHPSQSAGEILLKAPRDGFPLSVLVELEIESLSRQDVTHALINFCCRSGCEMKICDGWGAPYKKGEPLLPGAGLDRAAFADVRLTGGDSAVFYFRMKVRTPGTYPIFVTIGSGSLYETFERGLDVHVVESEAQSLRDRVGPLIDEIESITKQSADAFRGESAMRQAVVESTFRAHRLLLETRSQDAIDRFRNAEADYVGARNGEGYLRALAAAQAKILYEIRDALGREEEATPDNHGRLEFLFLEENFATARAARGSGG